MFHNALLLLAHHDGINNFQFNDLKDIAFQKMRDNFDSSLALQRIYKIR